MVCIHLPAVGRIPAVVLRWKGKQLAQTMRTLGEVTRGADLQHFGEAIRQSDFAQNIAPLI